MSERSRVGIYKQEKQVIRPGAAAERVHRESVRLKSGQLLRLEKRLGRIRVVAS